MNRSSKSLFFGFVCSSLVSLAAHAEPQNRVSISRLELLLGGSTIPLSQVDDSFSDIPPYDSGGPFMFGLKVAVGRRVDTLDFGHFLYWKRSATANTRLDVLGGGVFVEHKGFQITRGHLLSAGIEVGGMGFTAVTLGDKRGSNARAGTVLNGSDMFAAPVVAYKWLRDLKDEKTGETILFSNRFSIGYTQPFFNHRYLREFVFSFGSEVEL